MENVTRETGTAKNGSSDARRGVWLYVKRIGLGAIVLSLVIGHLVLLQQIIAFAQTGEWTNDGLRDLDDYLGLATPATISSVHLINELWLTFLLNGSLALTFIFYIPLLLLILGLVLYLLTEGADEAVDEAEIDPQA